MNGFFKNSIYGLYFAPAVINSPTLDFYFKQVTINPYIKEKIDYVKLGYRL